MVLEEITIWGVGETWVLTALTKMYLKSIKHLNVISKTIKFLGENRENVYIGVEEIFLK